MVALAQVRAANAALAEKGRKKPFVAVVAGGTSGIGECGVRALAATFRDRGADLRVYIAGRNRDAAERIIRDCEAACPGGTFRFLSGDLCLLKEVDRVCAEIARAEGEKKQEGEGGEKEAWVDYLLLCQGVISSSREDTPEGIDKYISLMYYSRMLFVTQLLPLLARAGGHAVSVLNPTTRPRILVDDLTLRDPAHQGLSTYLAHVAPLTTVFMAELARRGGGGPDRPADRVSLCHCYPGYVPTPAARNSNLPGWLKFLLVWVLNPLNRWRWMPLEECGQRMLFMASSERFPARRPPTPGGPTPEPGSGGLEAAAGVDGVLGSGAYRVTQHGDACPHMNEYNEMLENGDAAKVYDHTIRVFLEIEAGRVYKD
ncbi:hypothetical protein F4778DRAFT_783747 [Xylariomycetidae sp. FL2044]|nr:hypothetical protein F4778DRAFT_783747 [Xylariomycetidae sp. FL2044]